MANYVVSYDAFSAYQIEAQLVAFVRNNRNITQWSQPYRGLFLVKTDQNLATLNLSFRDFFGIGVQHFIAQVEGSKSSGMLPQAVWDWFNQPDNNAFSNFLKHLEDYNKGLSLEPPRRG